MQKLISKKLIFIAIAAIIGLFAYGNFTPPPPANTIYEYAVLYESIKWVYADYNNSKKKEYYVWFKSGEYNTAQKSVSDDVAKAKHISDALNTLGGYGWELIESHYEEGETWSSQAFYFKRPKP